MRIWVLPENVDGAVTTRPPLCSVRWEKSGARRRERQVPAVFGRRGLGRAPFGHRQLADHFLERALDRHLLAVEEDVGERARRRADMGDLLGVDGDLGRRLPSSTRRTWPTAVSCSKRKLTEVCLNAGFHRRRPTWLRKVESRFKFGSGEGRMNDLGQAAVSADKAPRTERGRQDGAQIARGGGAGIRPARLSRGGDHRHHPARRRRARHLLHLFREQGGAVPRARPRHEPGDPRPCRRGGARRAGPARRRADRPCRLHRLHPQASRALPDHRGGAVRRRGRLSRTLSDLRRRLSPQPRRRRARAARSPRGRTSCAPGR